MYNDDVIVVLCTMMMLLWCYDNDGVIVVLCTMMVLLWCYVQ